VNGVAVLRCAAGAYRFDRVLPLEPGPGVMALTHDGRMLIVPDGSFIAFVDVQRALAGSDDAISGAIEQNPDDDGDGFCCTTISADDRVAFVAEEGNAKVAVVDLQKVRTTAASRADIISEISVGLAPSAVTLSADGKDLFVADQFALKRDQYPNACTPEGEPDPKAKKEPPGSVVIIDVANALADPTHAVVSEVPAGCHPVRMSLSPDGSTLWVAARASNALLALAVRALVAGSKAQVAEVPVGASPVPMTVTPDDSYVLAANTDRFGPSAKGRQNIVVTDAHTHAVVGRIPVGVFPRQFNTTLSGSHIFLCNYGSHSLTIIDPRLIGTLIRPLA
jgi:DNA-binding beta-propeller fold protein YncE